MNATQAYTRLRKIYGAKAQIRDNKRQSSDAIREEARAKRLDVNERKKAAYTALEARQKEILAADSEYQRLLAAYTEVRAEQDATPFGHQYRYSVGVSSSFFFRVEAEADSLQELVDKAEAKKSERAA